ncbi:Rec8 like protein-domain-containing protein [Polychytrium aggregatum]|uniref:Rec8 like protein-domain-containing protein n=1 Tax=Polychytrium aggregatum TaxID=110093 RepID=UPI0022FE126C|nr:Rec8 like protein-domain-containing protein [Polychytrium aggregatum]KAI9199399.1 Rec8 like protein-domain-containing protein [Polychytrium aggregatum]
MFFSENLFTKKGPLAKVWLAAVWERKLSKSQFIQTNIQSSVSAIVGGDGQAPMALRLSGQLLLGVVRVYSRKTRYLLEDCNEAMMKIKMAFRPGIVDMPEEQDMAPANTISIATNMTELDIALENDRLDLFIQNLRAQSSGALPSTAQTISRRDDITITQSRRLSQSFEDQHDIFAQAAGGDLNNNEESFLNFDLDFGLDDGDKTFDRGNISADVLDFGEDSRFTTSIEVGRDAPAVADRPFSPGRPGKILDFNAENPAENPAEASNIDLDFGDGFMDMDVPGAEAPHDQPFPGDASHLEQLPEHEAGGDLFVLDPMDLDSRVEDSTILGAPSEAGQPERRARQAPKRRKIGNDDRTQIPNADMRNALNDTSDIVLQEHYAPGSRTMSRLMQTRRLGMGYFQDINSPLELPPELDGLFGRHASQSAIRPVFLQASVLGKRKADADALDVEAARRLSRAPELPDDLLPQPEEPLAAKEGDASVSIAPLGEFEQEYQGDFADFDQPYGGDMPGDILPEESLHQLEPATEAGPLLEGAPVLPDDPEYDEALDEINESTGLSKSTVKTITLMQSEFENDHDKEIQFNTLAAQTRRSETVRLFFELLVLKTKDMINVSQPEPFGNIAITAKSALFE